MSNMGWIALYIGLDFGFDIDLGMRLVFLE